MRSHPRLSNWIGRYVPIAQWLPRYERSFLGADLLAGLAVWAVLVPQAVAYAALAGAPPEAGLFAALAAGVAYAVFGTCRQLDVGPSSTIAITAAAAIGVRRGEVPGPGLRDAPRRARPAHRRRARRGRARSARVRLGVPRPPGARRLHQRHRRSSSSSGRSRSCSGCRSRAATCPRRSGARSARSTRSAGRRRSSGQRARRAARAPPRRAAGSVGARRDRGLGRRSAAPSTSRPTASP